MDFVFREDPPYEVWIQLLRAAYASDQWSLAESDMDLWKKAFGKSFRMIVAYDKASFFPVGCICSVTYRHKARMLPSSVLGLFYVMKDFRGRGIGNELFRRIIADKQQHNLFLNGMSYMVEKYKIHYNFVVENPWKAIWYQIPPNKVNKEVFSISCKIVPLNGKNMARVLEYDAFLQDDLDRTSFLKLFISQSCADTWVALDDSDRVIGYATARLLINGELFIGPLYSDSPETAASLLFQLLHGKHEDKYRNLQFQIPSTNEASKEMVEKLSDGHCTKEDYTIGLSTKFRLKTDVSKVFSTTEYDFSFV